jgi:hypothetical protein
LIKQCGPGAVESADPDRRDLPVLRIDIRESYPGPGHGEKQNAREDYIPGEVDRGDA